MYHLFHAPFPQVVVNVITDPGKRRAISSLTNEEVIRILIWIQKPDHYSRHVNFPLMSRIVLWKGWLRYLWMFPPRGNPFENASPSSSYHSRASRSVEQHARHQSHEHYRRDEHIHPVLFHRKADNGKRQTWPHVAE